MVGPSEAFEQGGDDRGVLVLHGFTGTPFEVRPVAEHLAARGMTVVAPRLPGHGTTPEELDGCRAADWEAAVDRALDALRGRCRAVAIVGQSLGALLALRTAARRPGDVAALACLGTPLRLFPDARALVAAVRRVPALARLGPLRKTGGSDVADRAMWKANPSYPVIPLRALVELDDLRRRVRADLGRVTAPLLVVHALHDHVAPFDCADELAGGVGSREIRRLDLPRSFHIVSMDLERGRVGEEVAAFVIKHLG